MTKAPAMPASKMRDPQQWAQIRSLMDDLVERPAAERETRLAGMNLDAAVLAETRALLLAVDQAEGFMTVLPTIELVASSSYRSLPEGTRVGPFVVDALVGRGGHGEVYSASRADGQFAQRVALKLLRPEALSQFENFRAERQILASLEHPGIARLIDGGVAPDGRPYMAMEYIEGVPIDEFCRNSRLDMPARVRLLKQVSAAVAYAQANLVVHGDIKPGNILVTGDGQPKLLDFGVSRLIEMDEQTSGLTAALSTPAYAAPEQLSGKRATIATDIYALGAVLYEILAGQAAWQLGDSPVSWASRILNDEPPLPSTVAKGVEVHALRGDLDSIVARSMRARPVDRYETVPAMMDDLQRYLDHRPVLARNGNGFYRLSRFLRRHAVPVAASALLILTIIVGSTAVGWNTQRANASRVSAQLESDRGEALRDFMALLFRAAYDRRETGLHDAGEILDASAERLQHESAEGAINPQLVRALGELYFEAEEYTAAKPFLESYVSLAGQRGDPALVAQAQRLLAAIALREGDVPGTEKLIAGADAFFARDTNLYARERAELDGLRAALLRETGHGPEAIALLRTVLGRLEEQIGANSLDVMILQNNLAIHLVSSGDTAGAQQQIDALNAALVRTGRSDSSVGLAALGAEGLIAQRLGDVERALGLFQRAVETRKRIYAPSASLAALEFYYATGLIQLGRYDEAITVLDEAKAVSDEFGDQGSIYISILANRGLALIGEGRLDEARIDIDRAVTLASEKFGLGSTNLALALMSRGQLRFHEGDHAGARADFDQIRPIFVAMAGGGTSYVAVIDQIMAQMPPGDVP